MTEQIGHFFAFGDLSRQHQSPFKTLRNVDAEFRELPTDHVHQLSSLLHQKGACAVQRQYRLLLAGLNRHEPHRRTCHRLADRCRISRIRLAPFDIRLDRGWRHQAHVMSQSQELTGPMMRRATGFNADKARSQLGKKRQNLRATDRSADDNIARCVHCMDLKNVLRQIKANGADFHDGWLLRSCDASITSTPWRPDAVSGSHPHHLLWRSRTTSLSGDYGRKPVAA